MVLRKVDISPRELAQIRREGALARAKIARETHLSDDQIRRGLLRVMDAVLGTRKTTGRR